MWSERMSKIGKRLKGAREGLDREKAYAIDEAIKVVKERAKAKFDETVEVSMNLGVDPKHADQMVRGVCNLPNGSGRTQRVAVFARGAKAEEAKAAGADVVGAEDLVEQVIEHLAPTRGVELVNVTDEDEYFPPPRELRELLPRLVATLAAGLGTNPETLPARAGMPDDRSVDASTVLADLAP